MAICPARSAVAALDQLQSILRALPEETDPGRIVRIGTASLYADRLADLREPSWKVVLQGRDGGPADSAAGRVFRDERLAGGVRQHLGE